MCKADVEETMKCTLILSVMLATLPAAAQGGFQTVIPDKPINLQVTPDTLWVEGHWIALDKQSTLSGPSVSTISCDRHSGECDEQQANITVMDNAFSLSADVLEYKIERWTNKEVVASNVAGICKVRNVLKFDLEAKRVFSLQTLSEPVDEKLPQMSKDACKKIGMNLELKASTMWAKQ
jgi:hypothetical protein